MTQSLRESIATKQSLKRIQQLLTKENRESIEICLYIGNADLVVRGTRTCRETTGFAESRT